MNYEHICQSCGRPLNSGAIRGHATKDSISNTYCLLCYNNGAFTHPDITLGEMKTVVKTRLREKGVPENLIHLELEVLPLLKRWKDKGHIL